MKQLIQDLNSGRIEHIDVGVPVCPAHSLVVRTDLSLVSSGTEHMLAEFSEASLLGKARREPERLRQVLNKARVDGIIPTWTAVQGKLSESIPMGYCNLGRVVEVGSSVVGFGIGDRVVSNGPHAQYVQVSNNLAARVPECVSRDDGVFTVVASVAVNAIRLSQPEIGAVYAVVGMGLLGFLTALVLRANGCEVIAIEPDAARRKRACELGFEVYDSGIEEIEDFILARTSSRGCDAVLVTASGKSSEPVRLGARICRQQGCLVLVGEPEPEFSRRELYDRELTVKIARSYGPGRYDQEYERGLDYPVSHVRWTAKRNFEAVLNLMKSGHFSPQRLITHRFDFEHAKQGYETLKSGADHLGIVLSYTDVSEDVDAEVPSPSIKQDMRRRTAGREPTVGVIGAGNHARRTLLPALRKLNAKLRCVVSSTGLSAAQAVTKFDVEYSATDVSRLLEDEAIDAVVIATRHDTHADLVCRALDHGKNVFVEKPPAIKSEELSAIQAALTRNPDAVLAVGFNRRHSDLAKHAKTLLQSCSRPRSVNIRVCPGALAADHWLRNRNVGGGRLIGEGCHFVDFARWLIEAPIISANAVPLGVPEDRTAVGGGFIGVLNFGPAGTALIEYTPVGHSSMPKERIEVSAGSRSLAIDNFRRMSALGVTGGGRRLWRQDKGHEACLKAFLRSVSGGEPPEDFDVVREVMEAVFEMDSLVIRG